MDGDPAFIRLSAALTGFEEVELLATGVGGDFRRLLDTVMPTGGVDALLAAHHRALAEFPDHPELGIRREILGDPYLGPVARNLAFLWYTGTWSQLPDAWRDAYGASPADTNHVVSAEAYRQSLVWPAIGAHPAGAKQQGYGSWAFPPKAARATEARA